MTNVILIARMDTGFAKGRDYSDSTAHMISCELKAVVITGQLREPTEPAADRAPVLSSTRRPFREPA